MLAPSAPAENNGERPSVMRPPNFGQEACHARLSIFSGYSFAIRTKRASTPRPRNAQFGRRSQTPLKVCRRYSQKFVLKQYHDRSRRPSLERIQTVKKPKKRKWRGWTKEHVREPKAHSRSKTPVAKISKLTKRTAGALRQKALEMGLSLGHRR